ncbi:MAG: endonuclease/exonuclease/phosphatase, partial [Proteobacteria bacterium]|nr:endonuclease/exonuclease/phosphatase [Pseudomonadota bacterium]
MLDADPTSFGMPEGGREGSLVFASFNIRKLGSPRNRSHEIDFLARFCACCDLVAIQEVQDNLDGLRRLKERTEARIAGSGEYALAVSDITGKVPGDPGMAERLAFLYRHRRVRRADMAS